MGGSGGMGGGVERPFYAMSHDRLCKEERRDIIKNFCHQEVKIIHCFDGASALDGFNLLSRGFLQFQLSCSELCANVLAN